MSDEGVNISNKEVYSLLLEVKDTVQGVKHDTANLRSSHATLHRKTVEQDRRLEKLEKWQVSLAAIGGVFVVGAPIMIKVVMG